MEYWYSIIIVLSTCHNSDCYNDVNNMQKIKVKTGSEPTTVDVYELRVKRQMAISLALVGVIILVAAAVINWYI